MLTNQNDQYTYLETPSGMIKLANQKDIFEVTQLYDTLNDYLAVHINYPGWTKHVYPTFEIAQQGFNENNLYVMKNSENMITATMILNCEQAPEYATITWQKALPAAQVLVVHTLAVHPDYKGQDIGTQLLSFAENFALKNNFKAIRLDTFQDNIPADKLYQKNGFNFMGMIDLIPNRVDKKRYRCYEKLL